MNHIPTQIEPLENRIALSTTGVNAIGAQLAIFAGDTGKATPTTVSAAADHLVYAIYQLTQKTDWDEPAEVKELLTSALEPLGTKVRADKDKIAPRLVAAALLGSRITDGTEISGIVSEFGQVNGSTGNSKLVLTATGREAVVAQALKIVSDGSDANAGHDISSVMSALSSTAKGDTPGAKLQTFTIAVLKQMGNATGQLVPFMSGVLETVSGMSGNTETFSQLVAKGVAVSNPTAAASVLGAFAKTLPTDNAIQIFAQKIVDDKTFDKGLSSAIAAIAHEYQGDRVAFAEHFYAALGGQSARVNTLAVRAAIASGVIQNVTASDVGGVIDGVLNGAVLKIANYATFAGAAAVNTGALADDVVTKVSAKFFSQPDFPSIKDAVKTVGDMGKAVIKSIAVKSPDAAYEVARATVDAGGTLFFTTSDLIGLAKVLASSVPTNGPTTGFAIAGVASKLSTQTPAALADFGDAVFSAAPKAATNIAQQLAELLPGGTGTPTDYAAFAAKMALGAQSLAPNIAAGVAVTAIAHSTVTDGQPSGQDAGDIVVAVANADPAKKLQSKLITIAGTTAQVVDVERIADIGNKVTAVLGSDTKYPKLTSVGALATSLAKAINTRPGISTADRADELGELAAEMTRQGIIKLGTGSGLDPLKIFAVSLGSALFKGLSASLQINGGAFAADLKDAAEDIAGSIAQTLSVAVNEGGRLSAPDVATLLAADGHIAFNLGKAAKKFSTNAAAGISNVLGAAGASDRLYVDTTPPIETETVSNAHTGGSLSATASYEIGSVIDPKALVPRV